MNELYVGYEAWKGWSEPFSYDDELADYFAGETRDVRVGKADILEIGFGQGSFLAWAKERGARIAGTEINAAQLEAAKSIGLELLPPAFETVAETYAGRFDTIVAFDVFEHFSVEEVATRLKACERMLKPGGHLVLRFPNGQSPFGFICQHGDPTHKSALSRLVIEQLMFGTMFEVRRYEPAFRPRGRGLRKRIGRRARYLARDAIARTLNAVYGQSIPWDPVVVIVLQTAQRT